MPPRRSALIALAATLAATAGLGGMLLAAQHSPTASWGYPPATIPPVSPTPSSGPTLSPPTQAPASAVPDSSRMPGILVGPSGSMAITGSSAVALTFDDGPDPVNTPRILDLLKAQDVKATFCVVGTRVRAYPDLVRRIAAEGHTLCSHSWQHKLDLAKGTPASIQQDLEMTNNAIRQAVPNASIKYFRAPGGNFTNQLVQIAREEGMTSLYWSVDPRDWDTYTYGTGPRMLEHIILTVTREVKPGSIVLSHDSGHPDTPDAYRTLIPQLKARFTLIPLPEDPTLFHSGNATPRPEGLL